MSEETLQLEPYAQMLQGRVAVVVSYQKADGGWLPYEFLPAMQGTNVLIHGEDKLLQVKEKWKYIISEPMMQDWSVICSIVRHLGPPVVIYISRDVQIPAQAYQFFTKTAPQMGAAIIIERTEHQLSSIPLGSVTDIFYPQLQTSQLSSALSIYSNIIKQLQGIQHIDVPGVLTQITVSKLALMLTKGENNMWKLNWYKPEESKSPVSNKTTLSAWLRGLANATDGQ